MTITNLTFDTWKANHSPDHDDKWCRELYPFHVFREIDFDKNLVDVEQTIEFNRIHYYVIIKKIELQGNGRYRTTFDISTIPLSKSQSWKKRTWNTTFQIVYTQNFEFITVFTKKEDPSKDLVVRFMKGNFDKITISRSLPVSDLLFRTLLLHISEENYPLGAHNSIFRIGEKGIRDVPEHPQFKRKAKNFAPIYSVGRDIWICHAFSEEKAHRVAFFNANQCKQLFVIFCNPTYTKHHRCTYEKTNVLSLYEYAALLSNEVRKKYETQIRFLQNHLNKQEHLDEKIILQEINNPQKEQYEIMKSDLMEALGVMKIIPCDDLDFFHYLTAVNLINAFLSNKRKEKLLKAKEMNLFRNMYYFKTYLSEILTKRISEKNFTVPIFIKDTLIMVEIFGFQFSFHNVPKNEVLDCYEKSQNNKEIFWCQKRLQPIAPLLLSYSRALRQKASSQHRFGVMAADPTQHQQQVR